MIDTASWWTENKIIEFTNKSFYITDWKLLAEVFPKHLEALFIEQIKPVLNSKDEFRSRTLTLKLY